MKKWQNVMGANPRESTLQCDIILSLLDQKIVVKIVVRPVQLAEVARDSTESVFNAHVNKQ